MLSWGPAHAQDKTDLGGESEVECDQIPLNLLSLCLPLHQARGSLRLCVHVKGDAVKVLQQSDHKERHLIVSELSDYVGWTRSMT